MDLARALVFAALFSAIALIALNTAVNDSDFNKPDYVIGR